MQQRQRSQALCALKWSCTILACLILAAFVFSTRHGVRWVSPRPPYIALLSAGAIVLLWVPEEPCLQGELLWLPAGWSCDKFVCVRSGLCWWIESGKNAASEWFTLPLWIPFALLAAPAGILWYRDRRHTQEIFARFRVCFCPPSRRKLRLWLVALFCVIHAVASGLVSIATEEHLYPFFEVDRRFGYTVAISIKRGLIFLFLSSPLWGILWAWLWVRFRNRVFDAQHGPHCAECGYDLTGNVSGTCPECGVATARSSCG